MPSERFMRLPREKQKLIWNAAMEEFTAVPFEKVSINKIIQKAGISRGSFYTYFEDKRDLLSFMLEDTKEQWTAFSVDYLKVHNGDFWGMLMQTMRVAVRFCKENNLVQLHQNMLVYPGAGVVECPAKKDMSSENRVIYDLVDHHQFRDKSFEYFQKVMEQTVFLAAICIAGFYRNPEREDQIVEEFEQRLEIIRYGACAASIELRMEDKESDE